MNLFTFTQTFKHDNCLYKPYLLDQYGYEIIITGFYKKSDSYNSYRNSTKYIHLNPGTTYL